MKIYSYKINIDSKYQELVQSRPFLNCNDQTINQYIINCLKSKNLEINKIETQNKKKIIDWENIDEKLSFKKFQDYIKLFDLSNDLDEESIKRVYFRLNWKFEKINFKKKKILSLASGDGLELLYLRIKFPDSEIYSVDWVDKINLKLKSNLSIKFEKEDIYKYLKQKENTFDLIYAGYVLEHSYQVDILLTLINKSLISNGLFIANMPLLSYFGTKYYNFLKNSLVDKKINQIDGGLIDLGHPWKTNEYDLYETLDKNNFHQTQIIGNLKHVPPAEKVGMDKFMKTLNLKFKLNFFLIKPFKKILSTLFGNNINFWILKIYHRITRDISFSDSKIANYAPDILIITKKF